MKLLSALTHWSTQFNEAAERRSNEAGHAHAMKFMTEGVLTPDQVIEIHTKKFEATTAFNLGALRAANQYKQMLDLVVPKPKPEVVTYSDLKNLAIKLKNP